MSLMLWLRHRDRPAVQPAEASTSGLGVAGGQALREWDRLLLRLRAATRRRLIVPGDPAGDPPRIAAATARAGKRLMHLAHPDPWALSAGDRPLTARSGRLPAREAAARVDEELHRLAAGRGHHHPPTRPEPHPARRTAPPAGTQPAADRPDTGCLAAGPARRQEHRSRPGSLAAAAGSSRGRHRGQDPAGARSPQSDLGWTAAACSTAAQTDPGSRFLVGRRQQVPYTCRARGTPQEQRQRSAGLRRRRRLSRSPGPGRYARPSPSGTPTPASCTDEGPLDAPLAGSATTSLTRSPVVPAHPEADPCRCPHARTRCLASPALPERLPRYRRHAQRTSSPHRKRLPESQVRQLAAARSQR